MKAHWLFLTLALGAWPLSARAWEEQRVLEFVMVHNQVVRAHHTVTDEFTPPSGVMARMKEYTSAYGRAGVGGTDFLSDSEQPFTLQAGVQISIPLAGTKERREHALKMVEETRAMDELRGKVLVDIASLRQHEADLDASETKLKFYESKSEWLQKRVKDGFSDSVELLRIPDQRGRSFRFIVRRNTQLWDIGQKLHEERATAERLRVLAASARYQLASYAGEQWQVLLGYLEGKGELGPRL